MMHIQNLHTHTVYGDGKDTAEEMIISAIEQGFSSVGFSEHSPMKISKSAMLMENVLPYKREISELKEKYRGKIEIFCGLEIDRYTDMDDLSGFDYLIGSAHYFRIDGKNVGFDKDAATVQSVIDTYFGGNGLRYAKAYYELLSTLPECWNFDIIGHFDLITKHMDKHTFFDVNSKEYLSYAFEAMDVLKGKIPFFEVNTGAIARGYRTSPYPALPLLKGLLERGFLPVISSDCHDKNYLACHFSECEELLKACGAKEKYILTKAGFRVVSL